MKNKGGRPKIEISQKFFEGMCAIQCTKDEICCVLDIDEKTLTRWCKETYGVGFSDIYKKKCKVGLTSLRRTQFKLAEKNYAMAIFLGKQYLGQKDVIETDNKHEITKVEELLSKIEKEANE